MLPGGSPTIAGKEKAKRAAAENNAGSPDGGKDAQSGNSKAATVEQAIEYLKQLKADAEERDRALGESNKQIEELRSKLKAAEQKLEKVAPDCEEKGVT